MITLLQLSDLHRSKEAPATNDYLRDCLLLDIERHQREDPKIPMCDGIVVTGDLVEGVQVDDSDPIGNLRKQYAEAQDFLVKLSDALVGGDRSRVFLTPGNHDVCWPISFGSMTKMKEVVPDQLLSSFSQPDSRLRWSWTELCSYLIENSKAYDQRLGPFKEFFDGFYAKQGYTFSLDPTSQCTNFVMPDKPVILTSFCSLYGNDCFNRRGRVNSESIVSNNLALQQTSSKNLPLKIAFWHHSPATYAYQEDCLDSYDFIPLLIDRGYALGLHGHQHSSNVSPHALMQHPTLFMPIVSSGSLCAGPYDIPPGYRRQYNVLEIDEAKSVMRVHVREWVNNQVWASARLQEFEGKSWLDTSLPLLEVARSRLSESSDASRRMARLEGAERAAKSERWAEVAALLRGESLDIPLVRKLMLNALESLGNWSEIVESLGAPQNQEEVALMFSALIHLGNLKGAEVLLNAPATQNVATKGFVEELHRRLQVERRIGTKS